MKRSVSVHLTREEVESIVKRHIESLGYKVTHLWFHVGSEGTFATTGSIYDVATFSNCLPVLAGASASVEENPPEAVA